MTDKTEQREGSPDLHAAVERLARQHEGDIKRWLQPGSVVQVQLAKLRDETRCPMCFGKIRDARISMVCLHRYCAKCIEQYLRAKLPGRAREDKECPVCRAHLHSRRATRPDAAFDRVIQALYGDVDTFDAEEEALIAEDNKAHVAAWQAQLADMRARQAAAAAAAAELDGENAAGVSDGGGRHMRGWGGAPGSDSDRGYGREIDRRRAAQLPPSLKRARSSSGGGGGGGGAGGGLVHRQRTAFDDDSSIAAVAAASALGAEGAAALLAAYSMLTALDSSSGKAGRQSDTKVTPGATNQLRDSSTAPPAMRRQPGDRELAVQLLTAGASAVTDAGPRCCVVHLQPASHGAAGCDQDGKAAHQQPLQAPYLTCPWGLTVGGLKQLLLRQLHDQGVVAQGGDAGVQLQLLPGERWRGGGQQQGQHSRNPQQLQQQPRDQQRTGDTLALHALERSTHDGRACSLADTLTLGELAARDARGLGLGVQLQYLVLHV